MKNKLIKLMVSILIAGVLMLSVVVMAEMEALPESIADEAYSALENMELQEEVDEKRSVTTDLESEIQTDAVDELVEERDVFLIGEESIPEEPDCKISDNCDNPVVDEMPITSIEMQEEVVSAENSNDESTSQINGKVETDVNSGNLAEEAEKINILESETPIIAEAMVSSADDILLEETVLDYQNVELIDEVGSEKKFAMEASQDEKDRTINISGNKSITCNLGEVVWVNYDADDEYYLKSVKSANTKIVRVDEIDYNAVQLTMLKVGKTKVTLKRTNGKKYTVTIKVINPFAPTSVVISQEGKMIKNKARRELPVGCKWQLSAVVSGAAGTDGVPQNVTWTSSNKKIATIAADGTVWAKKRGKTTITASVNKKVKSKFTLKVVKNKTSNLSPSHGISLKWQSTDYYEGAIAELKSVEIVTPSKVVAEYYIIYCRKDNMKHNKNANLTIYLDDPDIAIAEIPYPSTIKMNLKYRRLQTIKITMTGSQVKKTDIDLRRNQNRIGDIMGGDIYM